MPVEPVEPVMPVESVRSVDKISVNRMGGVIMGNHREGPDRQAAAEAK